MLGEITQTQSDLIKSFAIFYLLLVINLVDKRIFTCIQRTYIESHKWLQIIIAFLLYYFLVTLVSNTGNLEFTPPIEKLLYSVFYFIAFLIVMRLDSQITGIVLLLIFIVYFLELNKDFYSAKRLQINNKNDEEIYLSHRYWFTLNWPFKIRLFKVKEEDIQMINRLETFIFYIIIFLLLIGFVAYGGEIHDTVKHSKNLTWLDVITDSDICKLKNRKSFMHYLKTGLGLKI